MDPAIWLKMLLGLAVLVPLASFWIILLTGRRLGASGGAVATSAIILSFCLSAASLVIWVSNHPPQDAHHAEHGGHHDDAHSEATAEHAAGSPVYTGEYWVLAKFGKMRLSISYYIDALTITMFCMVTLIASCIHIYAMGYMHDELHQVTDPEVKLSTGEVYRRPGRYPRFFQYLSLFCFSMLGLVLSGNIAMVFVFWELVGICSYFLIGFYIERKSASTAANKAFIVNRVGDFGMIIGLMALWSSLGTFAFGDVPGEDGQVEHGLFSTLRMESNHHQLQVPDGMVRFSAREEIAKLVTSLGPSASPEELETAIAAKIPAWREGADATGSNATGSNATGPTEASQSTPGTKHGYWLLVVAGIGIFCGCVGKSAQFPLHVWLPDAMEGPTPVSALVHSATMVAAGVYLVGRFYPVFAPEVLLVIAVTGCITLFMAATIAITATDIKRVLAYSTVSQLGYMMLGLGVGGWLGGLLHLITHAFFKSLLFMCSGSVIHAVHTNDMREMGGLRKKMPVTAYTMLIGCLAIAGVHIYVVGFSGHYSKDAILEQAWSFMQHNQSFLGSMLFWTAAGGAGITAFYMFRMWYLTFAGQPRNQERYDHAHESPKVMYVPLIVLSVFATGVAWKGIDSLIGALIGLIISLWLVMRYGPSAAEAHAGQGQAGHGQTSHGHGDHGHGDHGHGDHGHDDHGHSSHETLSPRLIYVPLVCSFIAMLFALVSLVFKSFGRITLENLLEAARPAGVGDGMVGTLTALNWPAEHLSHDYALPVTAIATLTALGGIAFATAMYGLRWLSADEVRRQFDPIYRFLVNKWWFDELYDFVFVRPTHALARFAAGIDRNWIDRFIDFLASATKKVANTWDAIADRGLVDGTVNLFARWTYAVGLSLREVQTGKVRQYVMFIVVGAIAVFVIISFFWNSSLAG